MIKLFKIIKGMYDPTSVPYFDFIIFIELSEDSIRTRGHTYKLTQHHEDLKSGFSDFCLFVVLK